MVRFANYTEIIRCNLENTIDYICKNISTGMQNDKILSYFDRLKKENYTFYSNLVGLLAIDHFKNLKDLKRLGLNKPNDDNQYDLYLELYDNDGLMQWIENNPSIIFMLLYQMSEFNSCDYFTKREMLINCKEDYELLKRFSTFHIFDCLYYLQKYDLNMLRNIFKNDIMDSDNDISKEEAILSIICTINDIKETDKQNYEELISEILVEYYMVASGQLTSTENDDYVAGAIISIIELCDYDQIQEKLSSDISLMYILYKIIDFDASIINIDNKDSNYQKTLEKLKNKKGKM